MSLHVPHLCNPHDLGSLLGSCREDCQAATSLGWARPWDQGLTGTAVILTEAHPVFTSLSPELWLAELGHGDGTGQASATLGGVRPHSPLPWGGREALALLGWGGRGPTPPPPHTQWGPAPPTAPGPGVPLAP